MSDETHIFRRRKPIPVLGTDEVTSLTDSMGGMAIAPPSGSSSSGLDGGNRIERVEAALHHWTTTASTAGPFKLHSKSSLDETQARLDRVRARAYKALGTGGPGGATTSDPKHFVLAYTKEIEMFGKDPENEDLQKRIFFNSKRATHDPAIRAWLSEHPEEKSELSKVMQHVSSLATRGKTTLSTKFKERVIAL